MNWNNFEIDISGMHWFYNHFIHFLINSILDGKILCKINDKFEHAETVDENFKDFYHCELLQ